MKVLVDMNLSPRWVTELRSRNIQSVHWSEVGAATAPDAQVLSWCAQHDYLLLTHDLDFGAILAASKGRKPSVIQLRTLEILPETMVGRIETTLRLLGPDLTAGALVTVEPSRNRVRLLPLMPSNATR